MGKVLPEPEMVGEEAWPPSPRCGPGPGPADGGWLDCPKGSVPKTAPGRVSGGCCSSVAAGGERRPPPRDGPGRAACSRGDGEHGPERCFWLRGLASLLWGARGETHALEEPLWRLSPGLVPHAFLPQGRRRG